MRPLAQTQDRLRFPLDELLRVESHVRILRVMSDIRVPISAVEIADYARMNEQNARNALRKMVDTGFVLVHGRTRQLFELREGDVLVDSVCALFRAERLRYDQITNELRGLLNSESLRPDVAWISTADVERGIELSFITSSDRIAQVRVNLQREVATLERRYDLTINVRGFSRADEPSVDVGSIVFLEYSDPVPSNGEPPSLSHAEQIARSIARSDRIASLVESTPDLVPRALAHVERLLNAGQGAADGDLAEWRSILQDYTLRRLKQFLKSDSPRAIRLRQSSPFLAVLTLTERSILDL
jgi:hypothetical protein